VACATNADCAAPTPVCDDQRDTPACVQCGNDRDCPSGKCDNGSCR
jgi:Cys-rich repeat protein